MRKHYYPNVPKLGNVAVSRHAQSNMDEENISDETFAAILERPTREIPDGQDVLWHEGAGIRIVILLKPEPFRGAKVVKTVYRIGPQAKAK